jgi:xylose isomerase
MYEILRGGGFATGGFNFDAKVRRQSIDPEDLFHAHIGGIDILARGLLGAAELIERGVLSTFVGARYSGWNQGFGADVLGGHAGLHDGAERALKMNLQPAPRSGRQEMLENEVNRVI